jgi:hypothetical protein
LLQGPIFTFILVADIVGSKLIADELEEAALAQLAVVGASQGRTPLKLVS